MSARPPITLGQRSVELLNSVDTEDSAASGFETMVVLILPSESARRENVEAGVAGPSTSAERTGEEVPLPPFLIEKTNHGSGSKTQCKNGHYFSCVEKNKRKLKSLGIDEDRIQEEWKVMDNFVRFAIQAATFLTRRMEDKHKRREKLRVQLGRLWCSWTTGRVTKAAMIADIQRHFHKCCSESKNVNLINLYNRWNRRFRD